MYRTQSVGGSVSSAGDLTGWAIVNASEIMQTKEIHEKRKKTSATMIQKRILLNARHQLLLKIRFFREIILYSWTHNKIKKDATEIVKNSLLKIGGFIHGLQEKTKNCYIYIYHYIYIYTIHLNITHTPNTKCTFWSFSFSDAFSCSKLHAMIEPPIHKCINAKANLDQVFIDALRHTKVLKTHTICILKTKQNMQLYSPCSYCNVWFPTPSSP